MRLSNAFPVVIAASLVGCASRPSPVDAVSQENAVRRTVMRYLTQKGPRADLFVFEGEEKKDYAFLMREYQSVPLKDALPLTAPHGGLQDRKGRSVTRIYVGRPHSLGWGSWKIEASWATGSKASGGATYRLESYGDGLRVVGYEDSWVS